MTTKWSKNKDLIKWGYEKSRKCEDASYFDFRGASKNFPSLSSSTSVTWWVQILILGSVSSEQT